MHFRNQKQRQRPSRVKTDPIEKKFYQAFRLASRSSGQIWPSLGVAVVFLRLSNLIILFFSLLYLKAKKREHAILFKHITRANQLSFYRLSHGILIGENGELWLDSRCVLSSFSLVSKINWVNYSFSRQKIASSHIWPSSGVAVSSGQIWPVSWALPCKKYIGSHLTRAARCRWLGSILTRSLVDEA